MSSYDTNDRELWDEEDVAWPPLWEQVGRICVFGAFAIVCAFLVARWAGL